jgi:hypothetical protein
MPLLRITNLGEQVLVFDQNVIRVGRKEEKFFAITVAKMEALRPKLIRMQDAGIITFDHINVEVDGDDDTEFVTLADINAKVTGGGDHGTLAGLGDNDHTQYQLRTEKNAALGYAGLDASAEISDAIHGARAGGTLHPPVTVVTDGFMTAADKVKLDAFPATPGVIAGIAGESVVIGDVLTLDSSGDFILASSVFSSNRWKVLAIAVSAATATNPVSVVPTGSLVQVKLGAAPAGASNGQPVFISSTNGEATLTPPISSGNVIYVVGFLQGANGVTTTPDVLFQPDYVSRLP